MLLRSYLNFEQATVRISAENSVSISSVIPILQALLNQLELDNDASCFRNSLATAFKKSLSFYIKKYGYFKNEFLFAAAFLDPRMTT
ncbi:hypothetical protein BpHYR1_026707 [Brachionus plicatilis]|uniref:Uncharacterized protein n=1 Tax=Brachionus plicatilis TaxID=10195 RepID=A0A3M7PGT1_BRAPC|nr:hypothetical protein BpHYR1_026707 [Brachionus plicatilis]